MMRISILVSLLTLSLLAGCGADSTPQALPTASPSATAPPPSPEPSQTATLLPPSLTPTIVPTIQPIRGVVRSAANIRTLPSKGTGERIGGLYPNEVIQIIGRNDNATWLWIIYDPSPTGTAWVTARGIELQGDMGYLPIVIVSETNPTPQILPPFIYTISGTPLPLNPPPAGALTAIVNYVTNVRVGPGLGFLSIGTLPPGSIVTLTGRLKSNDWLQIDYPSGPESRAWISANVLTLDGKPNTLPIYNLMGTPVSETGSDGATPVAPPVIPVPGTLPSGSIGQATILLNVRAAPSQESQVIGTLRSETQVILLGRTTSGDWYLIQYASAPNGRAWVYAEFIKIINGDIDSLPMYDAQGNPVGGQ